ncbi:MAG: efflux RND transporter periplasmic adaptor subunit, partial [Isosphaeraceae bacterium]|nr:efflux RND transporter periplasmic adaptor subunit [Isosphaeraceae bacterium]
ELERAQDRMRWTQRMNQKGYVSAGQVASERVSLRRAELALTQGRLALDVYQRFSAKKNLRELESHVSSAEAVLKFQESRLRRNEERLANLARQVESCTIRAPHDGYLIYANESNRNFVIEPGTTVHLRQKLFYLPDLTQMEVATLVHESVIGQVENGQRARVHVEALPDRVLEGHVVSVGRLPTRDQRSDVPYFVSLVRLDTIPQGLRPGMSAEVQIHTLRRDHVLAVPPEAVAVEEGQDVCYVAHDEGLERREVKTGQATGNLLEVTEGLEEGEEVVLDPSRAEPGEGMLVESAAPAPAQDSGVEPEPGPERQADAH